MNPSAAVFSNSINSTESQTRLLLSRIDILEKSLLDIHSSVASYANKVAKTRDICDGLAYNIATFSENEKINTSLKNGLMGFSQYLTAIQDFRDEHIKQIEDNVINGFSIYGELTRKAKDELKSNASARSRHLTDLKDSKLRQTSRSNSLNEVSNAFIAYELQIQKFEMKKICDLKKTFLEFTKSELLFHAKTIEMLTKAYKSLLDIDADKDMQEFCSFFNFSQLGSPKREESLKLSDDQDIAKQSPLRRFNSEPNFKTNTCETDSKFDKDRTYIRRDDSIVHMIRDDSDSDRNE